MIRLGSWLADKLSLALEPHERNTLRGDHAELGVSGTRALRDVLGLVIRRQLQLWRDWRPWLALLGIVLPLGFSLCQMSLVLGRELGGDGLSDWFVWSLSSALALLFGMCSWSAGFVTATLSRRSLFVNSGFLALVWIAVLAMYLTDPRFHAKIASGRAGLPLSLAIALLYHAAAFLGPWLFGLLAGHRHCVPRKPAALFLFAVPAFAVASIAWQSSSDLIQVLLVTVYGAVLCWPAGWILARTFRADGGKRDA